MNNTNFVTIIGLGLIGGSIAKALKQKTNIQNIIGIDLDPGTIETALNEGIISAGYQDVVDDLKQSEIIFICTPVNTILSWIKKLIPIIGSGCIITDVGSTKSQLISDIELLPYDFHFVGGHPMAGSENFGFSASRDYLFENAYYVLTSCKKSSDTDIRILTELVRKFGSIPIELSAKMHDKVTGTISHVPHIIAAGLVNMANRTDHPEKYMQKLAAGGFKDLTRISSSNPKMWHDICFSNKKAILEILELYIRLLKDFKENLQSHNSNGIYDFFANAKEYRDNIASKVTGLIPGTYELILDIVDQPGIIGKVATLLGENHINIKNLNISNNREFDNGVLIISLSDMESIENAKKLLKKNNYIVIERH